MKTFGLRPDYGKLESYERVAEAFYWVLRDEVLKGNPGLTPKEREMLASHYPVMNEPGTYPPVLAAAIYARRRSHLVKSIMEAGRRGEEPVVLDAGCGFGSESFLFASLGARVLAVDLSARQVEIARRRLPYYRKIFGELPEIGFSAGDLNTYAPPQGAGLSLTWLASVLAVVDDQGALLERIRAETRPGGELMVSDMNLRNPLFLSGEWRRRRRAKAVSPEFSEKADFGSMLSRRGRKGARYFPLEGREGVFDDVQFFTPRTLAALMRSSGFDPCLVDYAGFVPPRFSGEAPLGRERFLARLPWLRSFAYFYLVGGRAV